MGRKWGEERRREWREEEAKGRKTMGGEDIENRERRGEEASSVRSQRKGGSVEE